MTTMWAALQALVLIGSTGLVAVLLLAALLTRLTGRIHWARHSLAGAVGIMTFYAVMLFGKGVMSEELILPLGEGKRFCELDCHVTFTVLHTERSNGGQTVHVTVRELFEESSISSTRGNAPLWPGERRIALVDNSGQRVAPLTVTPKGTGPLFAPFAPGESHVATLVFAIRPGAQPKALQVEATDPISPLLIGHERSPFHSKVLLALEPASVASKF